MLSGAYLTRAKIFLCVLFIFFQISAPTAAKSNSLTEAQKALLAPSIVKDIKISPDGKHLALLTPVNGRNVLSIVRSKDFSPVNVLNFNESRQVGKFYWANNERLLLKLDYFLTWYTAPASAGEWYAVNIDGKRQENVFGFRSGRGSSSKIKTNDAAETISFDGDLVDVLKSDKRHVLFSSTPRSLTGDRKPRLFKVNIYNASSKQIDEAPVENSFYLTDDKGVARVVIGQTQALRTQVFVRSGEKAPWRLLTDNALEEGSIQPVAFHSQHKIYVQDNTEGDTVGISLLDLNNGEKELIYRDEDSDPVNFWYSRNDKKLYSIEYQTDYPKFVHLSNDSRNVALLRSLLASFPDHQVRIISQSEDENLSVIYVFSDKNPGDFYLYRAESKTLSHIVASKGSVPTTLADAEPFSIKTADGFTLRGYIHMPPKDTPLKGLVVNPHGGPIGVRDSWDFNAEAQLFASKGYGFLRLNFRGSGGFGKRLMNAGQRTWGSEIQQDIIEATHWAITSKNIDPNKVCIYGASFGGYSALQAPIVAPGLFKCSIGFVGVYDLALLFDEGDVAQRKSGVNFLEKFVGRNSEEIEAFSPARNADKLTLPILLIHGEEDPRAPIEHAYAMIQALQSVNYEGLETMIFEREGHGVYDEETRVLMYERILQFLERKIGDQT
jgi:dipeptidyl aminopeptidase/acylaminoacyl peptidase